MTMLHHYRVKTVRSMLTTDAVRWILEVQHCKSLGKPVPKDKLCVAQFMTLQEGETHTAKFEAHQDLQAYLNIVGQDCNLDELNHEGQSALHIAIDRVRPDCFELLLNRGANLDIETDERQSLLDLFNTIPEADCLDARLVRMYELFVYRKFASRFPYDSVTVESKHSTSQISTNQYQTTEIDVCNLWKFRPLLKQIAQNDLSRSSWKVSWIHVHSTNVCSSLLGCHYLLTNCRA